MVTGMQLLMISSTALSGAGKLEDAATEMSRSSNHVAKEKKNQFGLFLRKLKKSIVTAI